MRARMLLAALVAVTCGLVIGLTPERTALSHCEVPCGIYGDQARITQMLEDIDTIEKAMLQIEELGNAAKPNFNQIVRWTITKEDHATKLQHTVTQYFMTQRIKPEQEQYVEKLTALHGMLLAAMKSKQTTDVAHTATLRRLVGEFSKLYFSKEDREHLEGHHGKSGDGDGGGQGGGDHDGGR